MHMPHLEQYCLTAWYFTPLFVVMQSGLCSLIFPDISKATTMETHKLGLKRTSGGPDSCVEQDYNYFPHMNLKKMRFFIIF